MAKIASGEDLGRRFSKAEAARIRKEYEQTGSQNELAARYNCAVRTIAAVLRKEGAYAEDED